MEYFERNLLKKLKRRIDRREILAIKGPRQSGKTTLLEMLSKWLVEEKGINKDNVVYVTFEDRELLEKFEGDVKSFIKPIVKDENQRYYILIDEAHLSKNWVRT
jgi:predicted AAA+ superfamily ATPase